MIQRVRDDGWTMLRRGKIQRTGRASVLSFAGIGLLVIAGFFVLAALRIFPLVSFVILAVVMVFAGTAFSAIVELLWGAGVRVSVSRQPVRAGESFRVRCRVDHPRRLRTTHRLADGITVTWQGREEAVLRGYDTETFAEPFLRQELVDALREATLIEVPGNAMPTFSGKHARIIWSIDVETRTGGGLTREDFPVLVLPARS
jgi:hypothetical protein